MKAKTISKPKVGDKIQVQGSKVTITSISYKIINNEQVPAYLYFRNSEDETKWVWWNGQDIY